MKYNTGISKAVKVPKSKCVNQNQNQNHLLNK